MSSFRDLIARGLSEVKLVTSGAHAGLKAAIAVTLPGAVWQRCAAHYSTGGFQRHFSLVYTRAAGTSCSMSLAYPM